MELESQRLKLTEITWDDVEWIHTLHSFPEVDEFNTIGIPERIEQTRELVRSAIDASTDTVIKSYEWKIMRKDTGKIIGLAGIFLSGDKYRPGEIYYKLFPSQWGNGYATEVAKTLIKAGFEDFGLHRVEAGVATQNTWSIRVLEKAGMTHEGLRRKILPIRGEWKDSFHYAILEDDPRDYQIK